MVDGRVDERPRSRGGGDVVAVGESRSSDRGDLGDNLGGDAGVLPDAPGRAAQVIDYDAGPPSGE